MALTVVRPSHTSLKKKFRNACPPHRINDIDGLVKQFKGDEIKISLAIQEWWEEEPEKQEAEWQDVNKKLPKKVVHQRQYQNSGGRGGRNGPYGRSGRGFYGRGMGGGRGAGAERRSREHGNYGSDRSNRGGEQQPTAQSRNASSNLPHGSHVAPVAPVGPVPVVEVKEDSEKAGVPAPVTNVPQPKGAWGRSSNHNVGTSAGLEKNESFERSDVGTVTAQDPTPAGYSDSGKVLDSITTVSDSTSYTAHNAPPSSRAPVPSLSTGNVWATKGSAHLIQQEAVKQKPPTPRQPEGNKRLNRSATTTRNQPNKPLQQQSHPEENSISETPTLTLDDPIVPQETSNVSSSAETQIITPISAPIPTPTEALDSMLPASVNGANVNAAGWNPRADSENAVISSMQEDIPHLDATSVSISLAPSMSEPSAMGETSVVVEEKSSVLSVDPTPAAPIDMSIPEVDEPVLEPTDENPTSTVLMGRWDVSAVDDDGLDFGFGSFGNDNDEASVEVEQVSVDPPPVSASVSNTISTPVSAPPTAQASALPPHPTEIAEATVASSALSPPRLPPGISIAGMPPMPANAVSVHELEEKLESVSLQKQVEESNVDVVSNSAPPALTSSTSVGTSLTDKKNVTDPVTTHPSQQQPPNIISTSHPDSGNNPILANQSYAAPYGMGMYNYNGGANVGNGFMGIHAPNGPVLGGVLPQQPPQKLQQQNTTSQQQGAQGGVPQHLHQTQQPQAGLYGAPSSANVGNDGPTTAGGESASGSAGIPPPGMPAAMPYNPNPIFYGQQYYQMGQPHGGVGYGHAGYGQFNTGVQSGFAYQQVMGQNGGYGQHYDDTPQPLHGSHSSHHNNNSHQSYQKNNHGGGSGYRGRNTHHNNHHNNHHGTHNSAGHQYQNQYNPQHAGYGAQPYNMGYGVDQFGLRGGYVHGNIDPYAMQQNTTGYQSGVGHSSAGFQDDSDQQLPHSKGKSKGGSNRGNNSGFASGNPNMQQFQQVPLQQQGGQAQQQQQGFGFQGNVSETSSGAGGASNGGWSNQGWAGSSWQGN